GVRALPWRHKPQPGGGGAGERPGRRRRGAAGRRTGAGPAVGRGMMDVEEKRQVRDRFLKLNTATVCDVFDELDASAPALDFGIQRRTFERQRIAGWAYTIEGRASPEKGPDKLKLEVRSEERRVGKGGRVRAGGAGRTQTEGAKVAG